MLWQQWGHSGGPVAGEADGASDVPRLFDDLRYSAWFAKYLRDDTAADTGPEFEYNAPWLANHGTSSTPTDAYLGAPSFPVGHAQTLFLSGGTPQGTGSLVPDRDTVTPGTADFAVAPTTTTSYTETSAVDQSQPVTDAPGTFAAFASPPLAGAADQVGSPTLTVNLAAPSFAPSQGPPGGRLVVFAKLYDVAPGGAIALANRVVSPTRVTDVTKPVVIHLPSVVHRFRPGTTSRWSCPAETPPTRATTRPGPSRSSPTRRTSTRSRCRSPTPTVPSLRRPRRTRCPRSLRRACSSSAAWRRWAPCSPGDADPRPAGHPGTVRGTGAPGAGRRRPVSDPRLWR